MAIVAWTSCFLLTIGISMLTSRTKSDADLKGLVYSLTPKPGAENEPWYARPAFVGIVVLLITVGLNILFW